MIKSSSLIEFTESLRSFAGYAEAAVLLFGFAVADSSGGGSAEIDSDTSGRREVSAFLTRCVALMETENGRRLVTEFGSTPTSAGLPINTAKAGVQQVVQSIERRIKQPGGDILIFLTTFAGDPIVGNVASLPTGTFDQPSLIETTYQRPGEKEARHHALSRGCSCFPDNYRLLVGHDVEELENRSDLVLPTRSAPRWVGRR